MPRIIVVYSATETEFLSPLDWHNRRDPARFVIGAASLFLLLTPRTQKTPKPQTRSIGDPKPQTLILKP